LPQFGDFLKPLQAGGYPRSGHQGRPGYPGAATKAGVPADWPAELSAELDPVLTMLAAADG
jgi:hypothetical protein